MTVNLKTFHMNLWLHLKLMRMYRIGQNLSGQVTCSHLLTCAWYKADEGEIFRVPTYILDDAVCCKTRESVDLMHFVPLEQFSPYASLGSNAPVFPSLYLCVCVSVHRGIIRAQIFSRSILGGQICDAEYGGILQHFSW